MGICTMMGISTVTNLPVSDYTDAWHPDIPERYRNKITHGNARDLADAIPDCSVDLVFCDPLYDAIDDYGWLAAMSARVLRDDRACLAWIATPRLPDVVSIMSLHLRWAWLLYWQRHGYMAPGRAGLTVITPCVWFEKGHSRTFTKMADWCSTTNNGRRARKHEWGKPLDLVSKWINAFTCPGDLVFDPFAGSGVVACACKALGRRSISFEIKRSTAALARMNLLRTPLPLFVVPPEQMELAIDV